MRRILTWEVLLVVAGGFVLTSLPEEPAQADPRRGASGQDRDPEKRSKSKRGKSKRSRSKRQRLSFSEIPADEKLEREIQEELGETFKLKRTNYYSIFYNTSEEDVEVFGVAIERTYRSCFKYCHRMKLKPKHPDKKMISYFFNEFSEYKGYSASIGNSNVSENILGFYLPTTNRTYFYNFRNTTSFKKMRTGAETKLKTLGSKMMSGQLSPDEKRRVRLEMKQARFIINRTNSFGGDVTEETLQHEVAHQVLFNIGFHNLKNTQNPSLNPRWFAEGMAQIFEPVSDGKSSNIGGVNAGRLREYTQLAKFDRLIPLRDFISDARYFHRGDAGGLAYPQAWALAHYIARTKRDELREYVNLLNSRPADYEGSPEKEIETFEKAFGKLDKLWEKRWLTWMKRVRAN